MTRLLFKLGVGISPFWIASIYVIIGSMSPSTPFEYWAAAPWLIFASIPVSLFTYQIARLTVEKYDETNGSNSKKLLYSSAYFLLLITLLGVTTYLLGGRAK